MPVLEQSTTALLRELQAARTESDRLFGILKEEALYERPIDQRHRVLFYIGHLDGFDSIQICREGLGISSPDPHLDALFQAGIDPDGSHLPTDQPGDWPSLKQIGEYVQRCREHVDAHLEQAPEETVLMALEHRLMHLETLAYMFHNFDYRWKRVEAADQIETSYVDRGVGGHWCEVTGGPVTLGIQPGTDFGWDNEFGLEPRSVASFRIQRFKVTNEDYLHFVEDGAPPPHFWGRKGDQYTYKGMFAEIPLPLDWPVYVTQDEAREFAKWRGKALPTEEQFCRAAYSTRTNEQHAFPWGDAAPAARFGNFDFRRWDPEPVTATSAGESTFGVQQMVGNGWEWTSTPFGPFAGFEPRASYPGYSANFFDGEHYVIKGGSPRTAARLLRSSFRNWFRHDYPYVYATFRCVEHS